MSRRIVKTKQDKATAILLESENPDTSPPAPQTLRGPAAPFTVTGTPTAVPNISITTPAFPASQHAEITITCELDIGAGSADEVTFSIFDGIASVPISTWHQSLGNASIEVAAQVTVSATVLVAGNGAARTFGLAVSEGTPGLVAVPTNGAVSVVAYFNG